ncbi:MAG: hypothetical protein ACK5PP_06225 [Acidimicrobiales bacterium]
MRRAEPPTEPVDLDVEVSEGRAGDVRGRCTTIDVVDSPLRGGRGAVEFLLQARRSA